MHEIQINPKLLTYTLPVIAALVRGLVLLIKRSDDVSRPQHWWISRPPKPDQQMKYYVICLFFHLQWRGYFVGEPAEIQSFGSTEEIADEGY